MLQALGAAPDMKEDCTSRTKFSEIDLVPARSGKLVVGADRRLLVMSGGGGSRGSRGRGRGSRGGGRGSSHAGPGRPTQSVYEAGPAAYCK